MKTTVVSYSLTGNNDALAASIARELSTTHIKIKEPRRRNAAKIVFDVIFNTTPKVIPFAEILNGEDFILFFAPLWMGKVASPLRSYLRQISPAQKYGFVSICGGALGENPKIEEELIKLSNKKPAFVLELPIADLLPSGREVKLRDTQKYRLRKADLYKLKEIVCNEMKNKI